MNRLMLSLFAALAACAGGLAAQSGPEVEFQCPPGTTVASGTPDTSWGTVYAQENYHRTVRVLNLGDAPLTLGSTFTTTETNCVHAQIHYGPPYGNGWQTTLAPGEWQEFSVYLRPIAPGPWSFTSTVTTNDTTGGEDPYVLEFSGNAVGNPVGVVPALRVLTAPIGGLLGPGLTLQPAVEALDASGQRDTSFNGPITVALMGGAGSSLQLTGTVTVNASNGVAAYYGLGVTLTGSPISDVNAVFSAPGYAEAHTGFQVRNFTSGQGSVQAGGAGCSTSTSAGYWWVVAAAACLLLLARSRRNAQASAALRRTVTIANASTGSSHNQLEPAAVLHEASSSSSPPALLEAAMPAICTS